MKNFQKDNLRVKKNNNKKYIKFNTKVQQEGKSQFFKKIKKNLGLSKNSNFHKKNFIIFQHFFS